MRKITIDTRRPGQPTIAPSQSRDSLRVEAALLEHLMNRSRTALVIRNGRVEEVR